jgi:hypothetical protein
MRPVTTSVRWSGCAPPRLVVTHYPGVVQIVDRAPDDRPLVVRPSRRYFATLIGLWIPLWCVVLLLQALVLSVFDLAGPAMLAAVAWLAILAALMVRSCVRAWRGAIHRGPSVAADVTGLWLRLDPNRPSRTRVTYLTWSEVERNETQTLQPLLGRGRAFLCV